MPGEPRSPTQYLLGALVLKLETSCCTWDLPHLGL